MKIYIASDHAGFHLKSELVSFLKKNGFDVFDCGPEKYEHDDDYPDYVSMVAEKISSGVGIGTNEQSLEVTNGRSQSEGNIGSGTEGQWGEVTKSAAKRQDNIGSGTRGIVIGWSGQGEAMVANRFSNVRCAVFYGGPKHVLTLSREHNDANILSLGAHFLTMEEAKKAVLLWLGTGFSGEERHTRRIKKIEQYGE